MNVRELIDALSQLDPEMPVIAEGCDCSNPAKGVSVSPAWLGTELFPASPPRCLIEVDLG